MNFAELITLGKFSELESQCTRLIGGEMLNASFKSVSMNPKDLKVVFSISPENEPTPSNIIKYLLIASWENKNSPDLINKQVDMCEALMSEKREIEFDAYMVYLTLALTQKRSTAIERVQLLLKNQDLDDELYNAVIEMVVRNAGFTPSETLLFLRNLSRKTSKVMEWVDVFVKIGDFTPMPQKAAASPASSIPSSTQQQSETIGAAVSKNENNNENNKPEQIKNTAAAVNQEAIGFAIAGICGIILAVVMFRERKRLGDVLFQA